MKELEIGCLLKAVKRNSTSPDTVYTVKNFGFSEDRNRFFLELTYSTDRNPKCFRLQSFPSLEAVFEVYHRYYLAPEVVKPTLDLKVGDRFRWRPEFCAKDGGVFVVTGLHPYPTPSFVVSVDFRRESDGEQFHMPDVSDFLAKYELIPTLKVGDRLRLRVGAIGEVPEVCVVLELNPWPVLSVEGSAKMILFSSEDYTPASVHEDILKLYELIPKFEVGDKVRRKPEFREPLLKDDVCEIQMGLNIGMPGRTEFSVSNKKHTIWMGMPLIEKQFDRVAEEAGPVQKFEVGDTVHCKSGVSVPSAYYADLRVKKVGPHNSILVREDGVRLGISNWVLARDFERVVQKFEVGDTVWHKLGKPTDPGFQIVSGNSVEGFKLRSNGADAVGLFLLQQNLTGQFTKERPEYAAEGPVAPSDFSLVNDAYLQATENMFDVAREAYRQWAFGLPETKVDWSVVEEKCLQDALAQRAAVYDVTQTPQSEQRVWRQSSPKLPQVLPGIPKGYAAVAWRTPREGEPYLMSYDNSVRSTNPTKGIVEGFRVILKEIVPPEPAIKLPGVPEGYEAVRFGATTVDDLYIANCSGKPVRAFGHINHKLIVRPLEPLKTASDGKLEGLPAGYIAKRWGVPGKGERFLKVNGKIGIGTETSGIHRLCVEPVKVQTPSFTKKQGKTAAYAAGYGAPPLQAIWPVVEQLKALWGNPGMLLSVKEFQDRYCPSAPPKDDLKPVMLRAWETKDGVHWIPENTIAGAPVGQGFRKTDRIRMQRREHEWRSIKNPAARCWYVEGTRPDGSWKKTGEVRLEPIPYFEKKPIIEVEW